MQFTSAIVLAAGKGTRMNVPYPKILAKLQGKPLVHWALDQVGKSGIDEVVVVVGYGADEVRQALAGEQLHIRIAHQEDQLGTGHAAQVGLKQVRPQAQTVLVTYGDHPFTTAGTFRALVKKQQSHKAAVVITTVFLDNPMGPAFGRVKRSRDGAILKIVEQKMCSAAELKIKECNAGPVVYDAEWLRENIHLLQKSAVGEYYLTDLAELASRQGRLVESITVQDTREMHGVNTVEHLHQAETFV